MYSKNDDQKKVAITTLRHERIKIMLWDVSISLAWEARHVIEKAMNGVMYRSILEADLLPLV